MSITAIIEEVSRVTTYPDQNGGETYSADVLVSVIDTVTGQYANGNNCKVTYQLNEDGSLSTNTVTVPGQSLKIFSGKLRESRYNDRGEQLSNNYKFFSILSVQGGSGPSPNPGVCDLKINFITVDKPESATGAADGQITINASSSYGSIQYSNNFGTSWQLSPTFTGLSGGLSQPTVKDSNPLGCLEQGAVTIPTISNLLAGDPSVTLNGGHVSRWNAAFNPVVFTYQRKDFGIIGITRDNAKGYARLAVNTAILDYRTARYFVNKGDKIYLNAGPYQGIYEVDSAGNFNEITIITPFNGNADGYVNINNLRPYYQVITRITYQDKLTGHENTITATHRPNNEGIVKADISNFLQSFCVQQTTAITPWSISETIT